MRHQSVRTVGSSGGGRSRRRHDAARHRARPRTRSPTRPRSTGDDAVTVYATGSKLLDLLANDTDADGDDLAVCRVELSKARAVLFAAVGSVSSISLADYAALR